jgi:multimeric flavodoxin WrbA
MNILALGGSIRSTDPRSRDLILNAIANASDLERYLDELKVADIALSNTEILCGAALLGARDQNLEVNYFPLTRLFSRIEDGVYSFRPSDVGLSDDVANWDTLEFNPDVRSDLKSSIEKADAILLSSPVYFGDRSSLLGKVMQFARHEELLNWKTVAALSVGAKRNGGQETANVYMLNEASSLGALVVGSGPPHAEYGATAVAGDRGNIFSDRPGLQTAYETGKRLAEAAKILAVRKNSNSEMIHIGIVITMDTKDQMLYRRVRELASLIENPTTRVTLLNLVEGSIERCLGCDICPIPELRQTPADYACIIQTKRDGMNFVRETLSRVDGFLLAGLNVLDDRYVTDTYQEFTERSRFIRRNDFELTNIPISSLTLSEVGARTNSLFSLKVMTAYLRHNSILCPAIEQIEYEGNVLKSAKAGLEGFLSVARHVASIRRYMEKQKVSYKAEGYRDDRLNYTESAR